MNRLIGSVVAAGVLVLGAVTVGSAPNEKVYRLPPELKGRAQIIGVEPVVPDMGMTAGALGEATYAASDEGLIVRIISDEALERGMTATAESEAVVWLMDWTKWYTGYFWVRSVFDDTPGSFVEHVMQFGNGWAPGTELTGYDAMVCVSTGNTPATATVVMELWDGDPFGWYDTVCTPDGISRPIADTRCTFSEVPKGYSYVFECDIPKTVINCDRVHVVITTPDGCRLFPRLPSSDGGGAGLNQVPPDVGWTDIDGYAGWTACENRSNGGNCPTANGYNVGTCCADDAPCDHTDGTLECAHIADCTDGVMDASDNAFAYYGYQPTYYFHFLGAAYAATDRYVALTPVSADLPPDQHPTPDGWRIAGNEIILADPGRPVWLELRIGDWDPDQTGMTLNSYQALIDGAGYTSGLEGVLAHYVLPCTTQAQCEAALGRGSSCYYHCGVWPEYFCAPGYVDTLRSDFVFYNAFDMACGGPCGTYPVCFGGIADDPITSPGYETYAGTLALLVPPEAGGTFSVNLMPGPAHTSLMASHDPPVRIPLVGVIPAKITIGGSVIDPLVQKSRYLSFVSSTVGTETALRVTFTDLPAPYDAWNGVQMWVGPPKAYCENSGQATPPPEGCGPAPGLTRTFPASTLRCEPHYRDWGAFEAVHVFHEGIVSGAAYDIQSLDIGEDPSVESNYSGPTSVTTSRWGDLVKDCTTNPCGPPDGRVDITTDVTALLDKYKNLPGTVMQVRGDLTDFAGEPTLDQRTTIRDLVVAIEAFRGAGYPFAPGPRPCQP